jgi:hypothetical protein
MTDLIGIKLKNNHIRDEEASLMVKACSYCPKFTSLHIERNEIGEKFAYMLKDTVRVLQE